MEVLKFAVPTVVQSPGPRLAPVVVMLVLVVYEAASAMQAV